MPFKIYTKSFKNEHSYFVEVKLSALAVRHKRALLNKKDFRRKNGNSYRKSKAMLEQIQDFLQQNY